MYEWHRWPHELHKNRSNTQNNYPVLLKHYIRLGTLIKLSKCITITCWMNETYKDTLPQHSPSSILHTPFLCRVLCNTSHHIYHISQPCILYWLFVLNYIWHRKDRRHWARPVSIFLQWPALGQVLSPIPKAYLENRNISTSISFLYTKKSKRTQRNRTNAHKYSQDQTRISSKISHLSLVVLW